MRSWRIRARELQIHANNRRDSRAGKKSAEPVAWTVALNPEPRTEPEHEPGTENPEE